MPKSKFKCDKCGSTKRKIIRLKSGGEVSIVADQCAACGRLEVSHG